MRTMKNNSPLAAVNKKITKLVRHTVVKKLKSSRVQKSEIIGITGHRNEAGLDPCDVAMKLNSANILTRLIISIQRQQQQYPLRPHRKNFFQQSTQMF